MTPAVDLAELTERIRQWTRDALDAGVHPLVMLEAGRAALDLELGGITERIHEASESIDGANICVRCGTDLPAPAGFAWDVSSLVREVYRWGEPIRTVAGVRLFIAYEPTSGAPPEWCAFAMGEGE